MSTQQNFTAEQLLVPRPKQIENLPGVFRLTSYLTFACEESFEPLKQLILEAFGMKSGGEDLLIKRKPDLAEEAYLLNITKSQIVIKASTCTGAFRAFCTVRKLALLSNNLLPCCKIIDEPAYPWRGFMLDCSRHMFPVDFIKKLIDVASLFHLNRFHWHLTDDQGWRIPLDGYPELGKRASKRVLLNHTDGRTYGRLYTKQEIREVQEYAHSHCMLVVPELEVPGHASALLAAYPQFGCTQGPYKTEDRWGIFEDVMCPGSDELLAFLEDAVAQVSALFTDPYIHIGGDECPHIRWESCPRCNKRMEQLHLTEARQLQSWITGRVSEMVHKAGKRPIGWDEVLDGTEVFGLPSDLIVMSWRGIEGGIEAAKRGHQVIMCPCTEGCYLDYKHTESEQEMGTLGVSTLSQAARFNPVCDTSLAPYVLGGQGNLWTEMVVTARQAEYLLFPRLFLLAQQLWNPRTEAENLSTKELLIRLCDTLGVLCYRGQ